MSKHDEARRAFLIGAAAGAVAGTGLAQEAAAQDASSTQAPAASSQNSADAGRGAFFGEQDAAAVAAFVERLMPGAPGMPGAREAGVLNYIDLALAGAYADQQDFYRAGLAALDAYCRATHKAAFARLDAVRQDEVIKALEDNKAAGFTWPSAGAFFNTLRTHTIEGMFSDPIYGGNKDFAGWRLVGFPGAQPLFSKEEMASKDAFTRGPMIGLRTQAPLRRS
jgi:gluconate 2-dehydrogenase gamma chain